MTHRADAVESMEQLADVWRTMVLDRDPNADVRDLPGLAVRWADSRFAFWNALTLTETDTGTRLLRQRLSQAADIMRSKARTGFLWLFEDLLDAEARATGRRPLRRPRASIRRCRPCSPCESGVRHDAPTGP